MNKREKRIFDVLKTLAQSHEGASNTQLAACIVYKNSIVSFGLNSMKTHPFQQKYAKNDLAIFLHAETNAIYNALKKLDLREIQKSKLYVIRVKKDNSIGSSCPCEGCKRAIATFGIKSINYTIDNKEEFIQYK